MSWYDRPEWAEDAKAWSRAVREVAELAGDREVLALLNFGEALLRGVQASNLVVANAIEATHAMGLLGAALPRLPHLVRLPDGRELPLEEAREAVGLSPLRYDDLRELVEAARPRVPSPPEPDWTWR